MNKLLHLTSHRTRDRLGGRAYLWHGDRRLASVEAYAKTTAAPGASVTLDMDESAVTLAAAAVSWLSLTVPLPRSVVDRLQPLLLRGVEHRRWDDVDVLRVSFHDGSIWWSLGHTSDAWSSRTPRWRSGRWSVVDALLGKEEHEMRVLSEHEVDVPMPEGTYRWKVRLCEATWRRPRWPVVRRWIAEAECLPGQQIPHPGKGENAWDCDDDAMHGLSTHARTLDEAVTAIVGASLKARLRYGGKLTFTPRPAPEAPAA